MESRYKHNQYGILATVLISTLLISFSLFYSVKYFKSFDRVVSVKGLAEKEVSANRVIWPIVFKEIGNDLASLYTSINVKNRIIKDYLIENGLDEIEISVSAPQIVDMNAERYQSQPSTYRYNITSVLTITSEKVDLVISLIASQSDLLQRGVALSTSEYQYVTQFLYTKLNDVKPLMIEEATKNARLAADKFAKDSNSRLGKIKSASQGQFSINDRDINSPHIKVIRVVSTVDYLLKD